MSPVAVTALDYNYVTISYARYTAKIDTVPDTLDGNGYIIDLSLALRPHIALIADYRVSSVDVDVLGNSYDTETDSTFLGLLLHAAINKTSDFIISTGFINGGADIRVEGTTPRHVDADGGETSIGFRAMTSDKVEVKSFLRRHSIEDKTTIRLSASAVYYVLDSFTYDIDYTVDVDDGSDLLRFGITKFF